MESINYILYLLRLPGCDSLTLFTRVAELANPELRAHLLLAYINCFTECDLIENKYDFRQAQSKIDAILAGILATNAPLRSKVMLSIIDSKQMQTLRMTENPSQLIC